MRRSARARARAAGGAPRGPRGVGKRAGARGQEEGTAGAHMLLNRKRSSQVKARSVVMMMVITTLTLSVTVTTLPRKRSRARAADGAPRPQAALPRPAEPPRPGPARA